MWGGVAVLASIGAIVTIVWFFSAAAEPKSPSSAEATREIARKLQEVIKQKGMASSSP
jgi:hypothetical protein